MEVSMKKWLIALTTLVVLLVAGVAILFFSLNSLVEKAVNTEGPKITQTAVHLDNADISLFSGTGLFNGFTVGNPAGFTGHAASVKSMVVQVDTATVLDETIVIPLIDIDGPELVYELSRETSNFDVLMQNIKNYAESHEKKSENAASHSDAADSDKAGKKVIIDELIIRNAKATLRVPLLRLSVNVPLPEIRLKDIGRDSSGVSVAHSVLLIVREVTGKLAEATATQSKNLSSALLKEGENAGEKAKTLLEEGGKNAGDKARTLLKDGLGLFK